jgi:hypothetical protein
VRAKRDGHRGRAAEAQTRYAEVPFDFPSCLDLSEISLRDGSAFKLVPGRYRSAASGCGRRARVLYGLISLRVSQNSESPKPSSRTERSTGCEAESSF